MRDGFWQRQWFGPKTEASTVFDVLFGILLPILCFAVDPGVIWGGLSLNPALGAPLAVLLVAGLTMLAMAAWIAIGGRNPSIDAVLGGILLPGALLAITVGFLIFPFALVGLFFLIGALGFIPFGTAFVCLRATTRALGPDTAPRMFALSITTFFLVVGLGLGYQAAADRMLDESVREIAQSGDPAKVEQSIARLEQWRLLVPRREFVRRGSELQWRGGAAGMGYETAYRRMTGRSLQDERAAMLD